MQLGLPIITVIAVIFASPTQILGLMADKGYEGDSHPKELFRGARGEMVLTRKQHILFQAF